VVKSRWVARSENPRIEDDSIVYDIDDVRFGKKSVKKVGMRLDGRLAFEVHENDFRLGGLRLFRLGIDSVKKIVYDDQELPLATEVIGGKYGALEPVFAVLGLSEVGKVTDHKIVFVDGQPGTMWVYDVDDQRQGGLGDVGQTIDTFIYGSQINGEAAHTQLLSEDKAGVQADRDAIMVSQGVKTQEKNGRYGVSLIAQDDRQGVFQALGRDITANSVLSYAIRAVLSPLGILPVVPNLGSILFVSGVILVFFGIAIPVGIVVIVTAVIWKLAHGGLRNKFRALIQKEDEGNASSSTLVPANHKDPFDVQMDAVLDESLGLLSYRPHVRAYV
jgi:hypothetical protein